MRDPTLDTRVELAKTDAPLLPGIKAVGQSAGCLHDLARLDPAVAAIDDEPRLSKSSRNSASRFPGCRPAVAASQCQEILTRRHGDTERRKTRLGPQICTRNLVFSVSPCESFLQSPAAGGRQSKAGIEKIAGNSGLRQPATKPSRGMPRRTRRTCQGC